jgi:hypothetical protein
MSQETINFPSLDCTDSQTFLENERDGRHQREGRYTTHLQRFFSNLDYKQLCLLLKMSDTKMEECRQEAARIVQEGIVAGEVDVTKVEEYNETVANNSLDEFGKYVISTGAGTFATDRGEVDFGEFGGDDLGFLVPPQKNHIKFGIFSENDIYAGTGPARKFKRRSRERVEACVSLEAHAWQVPGAQDLYYQATIFQAIRDQSVALLRSKFDQHHVDLGAELMLNALTELTVD